MKMNAFTTGLVTGAVIGTAVGVIMDPMKDKHSKMLKMHSKGMFSNIGHVIDNMLDK